MKKIFFFAAIAALALSSCSSDELVQAEQPVAEGDVVSFSAYSGRTTRAEYNAADYDQDATDGDKWNVTKLYMQKYGFGVFAYDQGGVDFNSYLATNTYPNFMYNQKVMGYTAAADGALQGEPIWDGTESGSVETATNWSYTPLKYWPNNKDAKVTFQAYAPYDKNIAPIFNVAYKGVGIRYSNTDNYDLLWGAINENSSTATCYVNQPKPHVADKTIFYFKHALSKLDFTVSYFTDEEHDDSNTGLASGKPELAKNTKIVIRSIRLVGTFPTTGVLSLYDGSWTVEKADDHVGFTTKDLVVPGKYVSDAITFTEDDAEYLTEGNEGTLIGDVVALKPEHSLMVIPAQKIAGVAVESAYDVEIVYDVITEDPDDDRNTSVVTNTVSSADGSNNQYEDGHSFVGVVLNAGQHTTLNIHLGMTTAKFDAHVVDWEGEDSTEVDLPNNDPEPATPSNRR